MCLVAARARGSARSFALWARPRAESPQTMRCPGLESCCGRPGSGHLLFVAVMQHRRLHGVRAWRCDRMGEAVGNIVYSL